MDVDLFVCTPCMTCATKLTGGYLLPFPFHVFVKMSIPFKNRVTWISELELITQKSYFDSYSDFRIFEVAFNL